MLEHGGNLIAMANKYGHDVEKCIDLSTGINPHAWPVPEHLPSSLWSILPQHEDGLDEAAKQYYRSDLLLAVAGSQAAIQLLPLCRPKSRVGIIVPSYAEHQHAWRKAGHEIVFFTSAEIDQYIASLDVLIIINPNNPTGHFFSQSQLLCWHQLLAKHQGWLIVDEAFIDSTPQYSLTPNCPQDGLIVLRSTGKFFGLAGLRTGFVFASPPLLEQLAERLGPWTIAGASRYITQLALNDTQWQNEMRSTLQQSGQRLSVLLSENGFKSTGCTLFQSIKVADAEKIHHLLAQRGINSRLFKQDQRLRFGLAKTEQEWHYFNRAVQEIIR
jgi:cobalamin biosynthetic protein CobC